MTEEELAEIIARYEAAYEGPWYAHATDDEHFQSAVYVSIQEVANGVKGFRHDNQRGLSEGDFCQIPPGTVIAITAIQEPYLALMDDNDRGLWSKSSLLKQKYEQSNDPYR